MRYSSAWPHALQPSDKKINGKSKRYTKKREKKQRKVNVAN